jgi:DNA-binding response OmpR family regulator
LLAVTEADVAKLADLPINDFIVSPLTAVELHQRVRRLAPPSATVAEAQRLTVGQLEIDLVGYEAHLGGRRLMLALQEFQLLKFLAQNRGRAWTRDQLLAQAWGDRSVGSRTVDIHVRRLRAKLGSPADEMITTVRGVGYKMT